MTATTTLPPVPAISLDDLQTRTVAGAGAVAAAAATGAESALVVPVPHRAGPRRLTHEEATSPDLVVEVGERLLVDPADLRTGENVRRALRADGDFLETIRAHGVEKDIDVYPALGGLVILDGHRRHHAACALGLEQVPVRVVRCDGEAERIARQLMVNDEHAHTNAVERADAIQQLVLMGVPAMDLRRRGVRADEVSAAQKVAGASAQVRRLPVAQPGVTLTALAQVAELESLAPAGSQIVAQVVEEVTESPEQAEHIVARARTKALRQRCVADEASALEREGLTRYEREDLYADAGAARVDDLIDEEGRQITAEEHVSCPGHAVMIVDVAQWEGNEFVAYEARRVPACTQWRERGHRDRYKALSSAPPSASLLAAAPTKAEESAERRRVREMNAALEAANTVRRRWLRETLFTRPVMKVPARALVWAARAMTTQRYLAGQSRQLGAGLIGLADDVVERLGGPASASSATWTVLYEQACGVESSIAKDTWRSVEQHPRHHVLTRSWLRALESWGYTLSDVEQTMCTQVEAAAGVDLMGVPVPVSADGGERA